jgi:MoxR-like ATPase
MSNLAEITVKIARLPIGIVAGAYNKYHHNPQEGITKTDASKWLAEKVSQGALTIENIMDCPPATFKPSSSVDPALGAKVDATASIASKAQDDALNALNGIKAVRDALIILNKSDEAIKAKVDSLAGKVDGLRVDDHAVHLAVDSLVGDHFKKFAKLVEDKGAEAFIAEQTAVHRFSSQSCLDVFGVDARDIKGNPLMVDLWNHPASPAVDPDFIWTEGILRHLLLSDRTGESLWFGGEKGTGKSETARQFAARTGRAFKRINFHKHTTVEEYVGAVGIENGKTVFQPKDFLTAYAAPSTIILLDEITNADPAELATLNGFLEPNACVSFGGLTHTRAKGVLVFVADNTFGSGDDSGRYAGTRLQNSALVDRFARVVQFDYLPEQFEIEAIVKRSGCDKTLARLIHEAIQVARHKVKSADIVDAPSIRSAIAFARAMYVLPLREAWATTVVARQPSESHATLMGIYDACINEETFQQYL